MIVKYMRCREVTEVLGISKTTIYELLKRGEFPQPVKIGTKAVRWPADAIERWQRDKSQHAAVAAKN